jgi:hypothetical protein
MKGELLTVGFDDSGVSVEHIVGVPFTSNPINVQFSTAIAHPIVRKWKDDLDIVLPCSCNDTVESLETLRAVIEAPFTTIPDLQE